MCTNLSAWRWENNRACMCVGVGVDHETRNGIMRREKTYYMYGRKKKRETVVKYKQHEGRNHRTEEERGTVRRGC